MVNYDRMELWVNPTSQTLGMADAMVNFDAGLSGGIDLFSNRIVGTETGQIYRFDELRIGTTADSVVPIPEPSTTILLVVGTVMTLLRKRV